jgi:hypothetical protein
VPTLRRCADVEHALREPMHETTSRVRDFATLTAEMISFSSVLDNTAVLSSRDELVTV